MEDSKLQNFCLLTLTFIALTGVLVYTKSIVIPLVLSFFIFEATLPTIAFLEARAKFPKFFAVALTFIVFNSFIVLMVLVVSSSVGPLVQEVGQYKGDVLSIVEYAAATAKDLGFEVNKQLILKEVSELPVFSVAKNVTGGFFSIIGNSVLILIFVLFMYAGETRACGETGLRQEINKKISRYILVKSLVSLTTAVLVWIVLASFGVKLALLLGVLTFLLNFIPSIGSIIATVLPLPVLFLSFGLSYETPLILTLCGLIQFAIGNVIEPKFMGESMNLHPITILLALLFWGLIWGVPGMFLGTPITAILKTIFERFKSTRSIAQILAGEFKFS